MLLTLHIVTFITWFVLTITSYSIQSRVKRYLTIIGTTILLGFVDALVTAYHQAYIITNGLVSRRMTNVHTSPQWDILCFVALVAMYIIIAVIAYKYGPTDEDERDFDVMFQTLAGGLLFVALATRIDTLSLWNMGPFAEVSQDNVETVLYDITNPDTKGITICPKGESCVTPADFREITDERMFSYSNRYYGDGTRIEKRPDVKSMVDTSIDKQTYDRLIKGQPGEMRITKVVEITTVRQFQHEWFPFITATATENSGLQDIPKFHVYHAFTDEIVQKYHVDKHESIQED